MSVVMLKQLLDVCVEDLLSVSAVETKVLESDHPIRGPGSSMSVDGFQPTFPTTVIIKKGMCVAGCVGCTAVHDVRCSSRALTKFFVWGL